MDGTAEAPAQTAFTASFNVTLGPTTSVVPADGMSFVVGTLGSARGANPAPTPRTASPLASIPTTTARRMTTSAFTLGSTETTSPPAR